MEKDLFGGIEAGGTKFVCAVGTGPDHLEKRERIPTTSPEETRSRVIAFFTPWADRLRAVGIGSFGPLDIHPDSPLYGSIQKTPKAGWTGANLLKWLDPLGIPLAIDMDVAVSALGEHRWGAGIGRRNLLYLTVGTGIGGTCLLEGRPLTGIAAPEMGHILIPAAEGEDFEGICPFHKRCLEGLASGPALEARWNCSGKDLGREHRAWEVEADYLARGLVNFILTLSPECIILGGGVMQNDHLFPRIRAQVQELLNHYVNRPELSSAIDHYIVPPRLGDRSGILGCFALAESAAGS